MSNLTKIVIEECSNPSFAYQFATKLSSTDVSPQPPPCFKELCDIFTCLNKTDDYSKCGKKYKLLLECFNKFYK